MAILFAVLGPTNSGKTETGNYLDYKFGVRHIHPARCMKAHYEYLLGAPEGWLDTQEGKAYKPEGTDYTMQEIMVQEYHLKKQYFPTYSAHYLNKVVPDYLNKGYDVCVVSIRNLPELPVLIKVVEQGRHILVLIKLESKLARYETSDENLEVISRTLEEVAQLSYTVQNNGTLEELRNNIHAIASLAINYEWCIARPAEERVASY